MPPGDGNRACTASLVRPDETRSAVASRSDAVQDARLRADAAADDRGGGDPVLRAIHRAVPDAGVAGRRERGRGHGALVGARLLRASTQPAARGGGRRWRPRRRAPADRGGARRAAGARAVHGGRGGGHRLRRADVRARRQRRPGDGAARRRLRLDRRARDAPAPAGSGHARGAARATGRLHPGGHGAGRHHLHAAQPALRRLPARLFLRRARGRNGRRDPAPDRSGWLGRWCASPAPA